jgi:hypothetical protein
MFIYFNSRLKEVLMKKLLCVLSIIILSFSLLGVNNANIPVVTTPRDDLVEVATKPELKDVSKAKRAEDSLNVLFAIADGDQDWMRNALMVRNSSIVNIDYKDSRNNLSRVEDFMSYDVVLTYPSYEYYDEIAMGDTLAAYVDSGGRVITCGFCWFSDGNDLQGAVMNSTYNPFYNPSGDNHYKDTSLGLYDADHPMMEGVTTFSETYRDSLQVNPGAYTVALYADEEYLLGYKIHPSGGIVVGFNAVPGDTNSYGWDGQMVKLLSNIINWSGTYTGIEVTEGGSGLGIVEISNPILTGNEWLTLSVDSPTTVDFRIINLTGMVVSSKSLNYTTSGIKRVDFDVSKLPSGLYFLSLKSPKENATKKALVIR